MKKNLFAKVAVTAVLIAVILLSVVSTALAQTVVIKGEPDGQAKSTVIEEHFYSGTLGSNFASDNVPVKTDSYGMHFAGTYSYGSALALSAYRLHDYNRFTFSVDMLQPPCDLMYFAFGGETPNTSVGDYDFNIAIGSGVTVLNKMGGPGAWTPMGENSPLNSAFEAGKTTDMDIVLQKVSGKNYKITLNLYKDGEMLGSTDYKTLIPMNHPNGYMCIWGGTNLCFNIYNFKVYDKPNHLVFSDHFEKDTLTYSDQPIENGNWHLFGALKREDVFISRNAGPIFTKAHDVITAKSPLELCNQVTKPYEITFEAKIEKLQKNATFGFYFGAKTAGETKKANVIGISAYDSENIAVNLIKNGKKMDYGENLIPIDALNMEFLPIDFKAVIHSNYALDIFVGGVKFSFYNVNYDGYWGICNFASDGKSATAAKVNEVKVVQNVYTPCNEPDLSNNFAGIKKSEYGFDECYISDHTYFVGLGASLNPVGEYTAESSLYIESGGCITPKKPYTDFILQFDVQLVLEGANSQLFGVSFGNKSYAARTDLATNVNFECYVWDKDNYSRITANQCKFDDGTTSIKVDDYHFYKDIDTKFNFMIVAKNRTVYVYFKKDSEDISKLSICRAVIPDVNTAGYVSIYGANGIAMNLSNYKLTNIAPEATGDSAIALRESFDGDKISDKLTTEGVAKITENALKLSGGSIATVSKSRYYIANFTLLKSDADLAFQFSRNKKVTFSKDLQKITVSDGGKNKVYNISKNNLSKLKNTQIQLIVQGNYLTVAARGIYEPYDKLSLPIVEHTFSSPLEDGVLKWSSDGATIDDLAVYALDHTYKAARVNYEDDPNDVNIWLPKPSGEKKETKIVNVKRDDKIGTLFIILYVVIGAAILGLLGAIITVVVKKKRGKAQ